MARSAEPNPWVKVGEQVRDTRTRRGWSQQTLASRANVSLSTVSLLESAKRTNYQRMTVGSIWRALGLPADELNRLLRGDEHPVADDPEIAELREQVERSSLSERVKQTMLVLIDSELPPTPPAARREGDKSVTTRKHA